LDNDKNQFAVISKITFDQTINIFWAITEFFQIDQKNVVTIVGNQIFLVTQVDDQNFQTMPKYVFPSLDQWSFWIIQQKK
jgi:hypothetical protein